MSELYKLLKRKAAKVEQVSSSILTYEQLASKYSESDVKLVADDYEIGIEIEVEKIENPNGPLDYGVWQSKEDHSLREGGIEYVSVPIKGNRIIFALNQFYANLSPGYRFSPRCSVHIHLNMLDMMCEKIGVAVAANALVEKLLYKFVGGDREKSNFAVPFKDADAYKYIEYFLDEKITFNLQEYRYLGLNLDSIRKFGTLEFRHLGGTDDVKKILTWINLIFCIKKFASRTSWSSFKYRIDRLNTDSSYHAIVDEIFGELKGQLDLSDLTNDLSYPASELKRIKLENPLMEKIVKENVVGCHWFKLLSEVKKPKPSNEYVFQRVAPAIRNAPAPGRARRIDPQAELDRAVERLRADRDARRAEVGRREGFGAPVQAAAVNVNQIIVNNLEYDPNDLNLNPIFIREPE